MKNKEKQLLLKDLCARLPYEVKCLFKYTGLAEDKSLKEYEDVGELYAINLSIGRFYITAFGNEFTTIIEKFKPYLRPMSSMTEEERNEYLSTKMQETERVALAEVCRPEAISEIMDWLNAHHFDYCGLIEKGLAIEVTEENNPYK